MSIEHSNIMQSELERKKRLIRVATGEESADLVLKNADYVNVFSNSICHADIAVVDGQIAGIGNYHGHKEVDVTGKMVIPGFLDAHIHLESSLVAPGEFVKATLPHGTTTVVTDPHEIANVMGTDGIQYMMDATENLPVDVYFMLPSCVPATPLDESGAVLGWKEIEPFYDSSRVRGLAEVMDFVSVLKGDCPLLEKITAAQAHHKKIDGHAPDLGGNDLNAYIAAGVYSDHECYNLDEALAKLERGQFIMIREGTAARNLEALVPLLCSQYADRCMLCTDDKHPNDLLEKGHIDYIVRKAVSLGADPIATVKAACHTAARYFLLNDKGAIAPGYAADLVVIDNLQQFNILQVYKKGKLVAENGKVMPFETPSIAPELVKHAHDTFHLDTLTASDFSDGKPHGVLTMVPGEIITRNGGFASEISDGILKIAVAERHKRTHHIGLGFLQGYGLKSGAVATSISHDSHNLIVVGASEEDMAAAANRVAELGGGIVVLENGVPVSEVALPLAGIMSDEPLEEVNEKLEQAKKAAFSLGVSREIDPFMTLSFMALSVIPTLRITTQGVFDVTKQAYI